MKSRILIVGAGPAGVSTALFLAKNNIPSTLIDKEFFPRDKICGDGLSGWVISMLHKLDMGLVEELTAESGSLDSWGIKFYAPNMKHLTIPYQFHKRPNDAPGFIIRRKEFDNLLIKKVRENPLISLHEGVKITEYNTNNEGLELKDESGKKTFTGDMVVFADGATSRFAKNPGGFKKDDRHFATGLRVYYRG
ncbi:MAG: FAD-dependent oxidoreductase, partial [Bacteroidetes bacterium]|nr:FAD-dependent oxidoreductase [Bacteroidota bacterium]